MANTAATEIREAFRSALALSEQMLAAAQENDWKQLVALEKSRDALLTAIPSPLPKLNAAAQQAVAEAMQGILSCNQSIHARVKPWHDEVGLLLQALSTPARAREASGE